MAEGRQRLTPGRLRSRAVANLPRIACWQLCPVLALLAAGRPWPAATALVVIATGLGTLTGARVRGHWLSTLVDRRIRLLLRRRPHRLPRTPDRPAALLAALAPAARIHEPAGGAAPTGLVSRPEAVLTLLRADPGRAGDLSRAACSDALRPDPDERSPRVRLRLLLHRDPGQAPRCWLVVGMWRDADSADDHTLRPALDNTVRRIRRRARRSGLDLHPLAAAEVLAVLTEVTHTGAGRDTLREQWRHWHAGPVAQVGMALSGPGVAPAGRAAVLDRMLTGVPQAAVTVVVAVDRPGLTGVARLAAPTPRAVDLAADRCVSLGRELGVRLERLDGLHGPAVAASSPIGGDLP